jgi:hypothetical protein
MEQNQFNPIDALQTIEASIDDAKTIKTGAAFYYIVWGVVLGTHFSLKALSYYTYNPSVSKMLIFFSVLVFPLGGILSGLRKKWDKQNEHATSKLERIYFISFIGFAMAYGIMFVSSYGLDPLISVAYFPLLIGFAVFIVGGITKHWPSIVGATLSMVCCFFNITSHSEDCYWFAAAAALMSLIIPGLLMKNRHV